jgi:hypothetical protein
MSLHASEELLHHRLRSRFFWIPVGLGTAGVICSLVGHYQYDSRDGHTPDVWSITYHTLQLFVLHSPDLDRPIPCWLHAGRWLVALAVLLLVGHALFRVFRSECLLALARWRRGHIVICGLGRLGVKLAEEFRRDGRAVVAIEATASADSAADAAAAGFAVITGDARNPRDLSLAAVERAQHLIAVCDDEQTNVAIAAAVGNLIASSANRRSEPTALECWIFIADSQLRQTFQLQRKPVFPHIGKNFRVNVRGLDLFELAARNVFKDRPLDFEHIGRGDPTVVHLIIVGFGPMGQNLALQAAKIGHFANSKKLKVTVVEAEQNRAIVEFQKQYPTFSEVCDLNIVALSVQDPDFVPNLKALLPQKTETKELVTMVFCWDTSTESATSEGEMFRQLERDDATNLRLAFRSAEKLPDDLRFLVFQTRKNGYGSLFSIDARGEAIGTRMEAFGLVDEMYSIETLLREADDAIAKALHEIFYENQIKEGHAPGSRPALYPWDELREHFKESNRQAADHIPVKLRAIGYRMDRLRSDRPPEPSLEKKDQVELLAEMEHERWCSEKLLSGYKYGEKRDEEAKIQPSLVSWDKLTDGVQEYDRQQVRGIPAALKRAGYGIYSQVQ